MISLTSTTNVRNIVILFMGILLPARQCIIILYIIPNPYNNPKQWMFLIPTLQMRKLRLRIYMTCLEIHSRNRNRPVYFLCILLLLCSHSWSQEQLWVMVCLSA